MSCGQPTTDDARTRPGHISRDWVEAPPGFEPGVEVLQTSRRPSKQARNREFIDLFYRLGPPESA